jgi:hypothetical protein
MRKWLGQSEGDPMNLDHFWTVIAMMFPEDHSVTEERAKWRSIESTYSRCKIWKKIAKLVAQGVCDHSEDGQTASLEDVE